MKFDIQINQQIKKIKLQAKLNKKLTGFIIGNTSKEHNKEYYLTPIREFNQIIVGGVIIYNEKIASIISKLIDGKVNFIFVDSEKKISKSNIYLGETANIERTIKEIIKKSKLIFYKGNDLTVEAADLLLSHLFRNFIKGLGSKKITILGSGNIGSKLGLKLLERGAKVFLYRRNVKKLKSITRALNYIKPKQTSQKISYSTDLYKVSNKADILIGSTNGIAIIDKKIVSNLKENSIIIDIGKGTLRKNAIELANEKKIRIYRLDVTSALSGMVQSNLMQEEVLSNKIGTKVFKKEIIVSGGLLGNCGDIIVDNINNPQIVYGIANGRGDLKNDLSKGDLLRIKKLNI